MGKNSPLAGTGKRMREVVRVAMRNGYGVSLTRKNHLKLTPPHQGFPVLHFPSTPSDSRSPKIALVRLNKQIREIDEQLGSDPS